MCDRFTSYRISGCLQGRFVGVAAALGILATAGTLLFAQAAPPVSEEADAKLPIPPQAGQQKLLDTLDEIYELQKKRTDEEMGKLIREILDSADETRGKPADRFVLLRKAMELAAEAGDAALTLEVIDRIAAGFQIDPMITKGKMLRTIASKANTADRIASLVEASNGYIDQAVAQKRFDYALSIATTVYRATQSVQGKDFRKDALQRQREVQKLQADHKKLAEALRAAEANPADAEANLTVGQLYCFSYGDWQRGLSYLARGSDPTLAALAGSELATPAEWAGQAKLGDGWWDLAAKKKDPEKDVLLRRAVFWYEKAQSAGAAGLTKVKVEKRLEEFAQMEQAAAEKKAAKTAGATRTTASALPKGAVAIYTFDKATIGRKGEVNFTRDLSGKWQPAALIGGNLVPGVAGEAFTVAARRAYVDLGIPNTPAPKTVCFWARSATPGARSQLIFGYIASPAGNRFYLGYNSKGILSLGLGGSAWGGEGGNIRLDANWHHYAILYDGTKMGLFLDGRPCCIKPGTHQAAGRYFLGTLCCGDKPYGTGFHGAVDEFAMFNRVLSPQEIAKIFEMGAKGKSLRP